jgi:hypothetical protein
MAPMTWKQEPVSRGGGVDALLEHDQVHLTLDEQRGDFGEVAHQAGRSGQAADDELVTGA